MAFTNKDIFTWMQHAIVPSAATKNQSTQHSLHDIVNATTKLSPETHLSIYAGSYIARLRECMRNQFSALSYALGEDLFRAFADEYLYVYPSESYTLNDLGLQFQQYLKETRPDTTGDELDDWPDFIIELAGFEFLLSQLFDQHVASEGQICEQSVNDEQLIFPPVFTIAENKYPVHSFYLDFVGKREPNIPMRQTSYCAVTRINYRIGIFDLNAGQYHFLKLLEQLGSIEKTLQQFAVQYQFTITDVQKTWLIWRDYFIRSGILIAK